MQKSPEQTTYSGTLIDGLVETVRAVTDCPCGHSRADHAIVAYDLTHELGRCLFCHCKKFKEPRIVDCTCASGEFWKHKVHDQTCARRIANQEKSNEAAMANFHQGVAR